MPAVFLSHSSQDKTLARRIADDLENSGITVWLDEWQILVGDSIAQRIAQGLDESDFVVVLLSKHTVRSGWVEKEWHSKIGLEAAHREVAVLPLRVDDCDIPNLLRDKKYADIGSDYNTAIAELVAAVEGHVARRTGTGAKTCRPHKSALSTSVKHQITLVLCVTLVVIVTGWFIYSGHNSDNPKSTVPSETPGSNVSVSGDVKGDVNSAGRDLTITNDSQR